MKTIDLEDNSDKRTSRFMLHRIGDARVGFPQKITVVGIDQIE